MNWIMSALAIIFTLLRLGVRSFYIGKLHADDFLAIGAACSILILLILNHYQRPVIYALVDASMGKPLPAPYNTQLGFADGVVYQAKLQFAFMLFFWTCLWNVKFSFLMFYHKLFVSIQGYMRWWWAVVIFCILTYLASVLTLFLSCVPISRRFSTAPDTPCSVDSGIAALEVATAIDIASDISVMILPLQLLWGLRVSNKQKVGLGAIFSLGLVIVIFAIIRMVEVVRAISHRSPSADVSLSLWSILESAVACIVCSLPALKVWLISKRDRNYASPSTSRNKTGVTKRSHIRLYDLQADGGPNGASVGYNSDVALHLGSNGITKIQEVSVVSERVHSADNEST
ncbi:hypothetical protein F5884DRAFT_776774 [Xylogone sp. PMI_703]|nr:hypothetical protein F5884DRAFT_776774 [Xylogone sp. PMI_703]